jgi:hypothetical protein
MRAKSVLHEVQRVAEALCGPEPEPTLIITILEDENQNLTLETPPRNVMQGHLLNTLLLGTLNGGSFRRTL